MFFTSRSNPTFENCYATERPYTDIRERQHSNKESVFLPTALADLTQLIDYFSKGNFERIKPIIYEGRQAEIHVSLKELCQSKGIIGEESKWDSYVDHQLKLLEDHYNSQKSHTLLLDKAYKQLCTSSKIVKRVMYAEADAAENEQTLFWRVSHRGHESDIRRCKTTQSKMSFGDSLFSGYLWDGVMNTDVEISHSNYPACVYSYYETHKQGRTKYTEYQKTGYVPIGKYHIVQEKLENLSFGFQNYVKTLDAHELYAIKFDNETLTASINNGAMHIPDCTISSAACWQSGEEFHPLIDLVSISNDRISTSYLTEFYQRDYIFEVDPHIFS